MSDRSPAAARRPRAPSAPTARSGAQRHALGSGGGTRGRDGRRAGGAAPRQARRRRFGAGALLVAVAVAFAAYLGSSGVFDHAVRAVTLPLRHADIIRQQAKAKGIDPALLAGMIYTESKFRDGQVSAAGALGLMQITPDTAKDIARKSGGSLFETKDLATAQVNISYGAYYMRYLLNRFGGDQALALAAYNGGEGNVERWVARATAAGRRFRIRDIPYSETRDYVSRVRDAEDQYRAKYPRELGL